MTNPRFPSVDDDGKIREQHLPEHVQEEVMLSGVVDSSTNLGRQVRQAQVAPSLTPVYAHQESLRTVYIQGADPKIAYAFRSDGSPGRPFDKTTDGGKTWTQQGSLPFAVIGIVRLASGTLLAVRDTSRTSASNTQIARSTDDGVTWNVIDNALRFPPLSAQGICEGTDGSIGIAEYGNVGGEKYRVRRSTDDGITWTTVLESSGTEPTYDPGHLHSMTYDPIEKCHVAFLDRPDFGGFNGPQIWVSRDNMATWTLLGESVDWDHPNFVAPMYFENYIAWGSDNQINGRISRMKRADFYSGNWAGKTEHVFQGNQQAMYWSMPVRDDVWLVFTNVEHIQGAQDGRMGYASSVLVVDQDGSRVSSGIDYMPVLSSVAVGTHAASRMYAPSLPLGHTDSKGWAWIVTPGTGTLPVTQGWSTAVQTPRLDNQMIIPKGRGLTAKRPDGTSFTPIRVNQNNVELGTNTDGDRNTIRLSDSGGIEFVSNGKVLANIPNATDSMFFRTRIAVGASESTAESLGISFGNPPPEGVVNARGGSLYMCYDTSTTSNQGLWVKTNPGPSSVISKTGWKKVETSGMTEIPIGDKINVVDAEGVRKQVAIAGNDYLALTGGGGVNVGPSIRVPANSTGDIEFRAGSQVVAMLRPNLARMGFRNGIGLGGTAQLQGELGILYGADSPEGVVTARGGSIYLCHGSSANPEPTGLWVKEDPNIGSTGWVKK